MAIIIKICWFATFPFRVTHSKKYTTRKMHRFSLQQQIEYSLSKTYPLEKCNELNLRAERKQNKDKIEQKKIIY